jgi:outer membrane protein assembly factor BamB
MLVALDYRTCRIVWQLNVTALIYKYGPLLPEQSVALPVSRASPQIDNGTLFIGTLAHALLLAIDAYTGTVLDMINLNPHPLAVVTMSPTLYDGRIFVGVASQEEAAAALVPGYKCCTFAGNTVGVDFDRVTKKLELAWNTTMIPEADFAQGWSGAAVWGSQPSIDVVRSQVSVR